MTIKNSKYFTDEFLTKLNLEIQNKNQIIANADMPLISVVMPSLNQAKYIEKSILSVLNQDYPNKELIIIDGESKDETLNIIKKYGILVVVLNTVTDIDNRRVCRAWDGSEALT